MPLYVIERKYADQLEMSAEGVKALEEINAFTPSEESSS